MSNNKSERAEALWVREEVEDSLGFAFDDHGKSSVLAPWPMRPEDMEKTGSIGGYESDVPTPEHSSSNIPEENDSTCAPERRADAVEGKMDREVSECSQSSFDWHSGELRHQVERARARVRARVCA
uniref:Uncharacterized protein n=1 Tax=Lotharella oceanica TaxID=641309 RepID=A0A7S2TNT8_9EUKA|mmetsp:Transcript_20378/g.38357  ORF Transcript_20378/g.38357 Transcript_20378/m.38357 type:complete len:126 (+) Transcript_20378:49-426(+)